MNTVTIEKLVFGGNGLVRTDNGVVFVPGVLPGEQVEITSPVKIRGTCFSELKRIIDASASRRKPQCSYFGICGGCDWMYIVYDEQVRIKKEIFKESFRKVAQHTSLPEPEVITSPETGYRMRARLQINQKGEAGFFRGNSNEIVSIKTCPLLSERLNTLFTQAFPVNRDKRKNELRVIDGDLSIASDPQIKGVTTPFTDITVDGKVFKVNGGDFFQSNRFVNQALGTWFRPFIGGDFCIDLYGGSGFFSMMIASRFKQGLLIESVKSQVDNANANFTRNGINNFKAVCSESEKLLSVCFKRPDCLIVDPPRTGLTKEVRSAITKLKPLTIVYVSCNISTQVRDCEYFVKEHGYTISKTAIFDCYPNTSHIESVMILSCL
jgi:23S rRNA (uracil1939-C5)-methyltransferase